MNIRHDTTRVLATAAGMALLALLAACQPTAPAPMPGYAEAELLYVAPTATATLAQLAVARGQRVQAGQVLFTMERTPEDRGADAALARRDRAQAQADNLRSGRRPLELEALRQQLGQAQANLAASETALERQAQLVRQGFVSSLRLDELTAARQRDSARVAELRAQLAQAQLAARRDEVAAAEAEARASGADLALATWRQEQATRRAPGAGQVFDVLYRPGEVVGAGAPVVVLLPDGALKLRFFVPQHELARAAPGSTVQLACDGCAAGLTARIRWVSPQAEYTPPVIYSNAARAKLVFRVEAEPAAGAALRPGQPVDVRWAP